MLVIPFVLTLLNHSTYFSLSLFFRTSVRVQSSFISVTKFKREELTGFKTRLGFSAYIQIKHVWLELRHDPDILSRMTALVWMALVPSCAFAPTNLYSKPQDSYQKN